MEQVAAAGIASDRRQIRQGGNDSREVQYPSLDARHFCGIEEFTLRDFWRRRKLYAAQPAAGKIHRHGVPRILWRSITRSDDFGKRNENRELYLQGQTVLGNSGLPCRI